MDLAVADLLEEEEKKFRDRAVADLLEEEEKKFRDRRRQEASAPAQEHISLDFDEERNRQDRRSAQNGGSREHGRLRYKEDREQHSSGAGSPAAHSTRSRHDSDRDSANGSARADLIRRRSRSPEPGRLISRSHFRERDDYRPRSRQEDDGGDRYYRPIAHRRRDNRSPDRDRDRSRRLNDRSPRDRALDNRPPRAHDAGRDRRRPAEPRVEQTGPSDLTEDERDQRTVFVKQLAAQVRSREFRRFFEQIGEVREVQIVKDRVSGRSKGVGYVEFKDIESVEKSLNLTGHKLMDVPIIVERTDAEKNRAARAAPANTLSSGQPFNRLYVGNINFNVTEDDLRTVFASFGELEFVQLQKEDNGRSKGYGFVHFANPAEAKDALEKMQGFEVAGRQIRVGLGTDHRATSAADTAQNMQQRLSQDEPQGSSFSGFGGRGQHAGGSGNFDRAGGRDADRTGGASALDDNDVAGVNFANYSRSSLMNMLSREQPVAFVREAQNTRAPVVQPTATRCLCLKPMWSQQDTEKDNWADEIKQDVGGECNEKYGRVLHVGIDQSSQQGEVYVKFVDTEASSQAYRGLNGRYFAGVMLTASYVVDAVYSALFPESAALR